MFLFYPEITYMRYVISQAAVNLAKMLEGIWSKGGQYPYTARHRYYRLIGLKKG